MKSNSLMSDHAIALARASLDVVAPGLGEMERRRMFDLLFRAALAMLESYEAQADLMRRRMNPRGN